MIACWTKSAIRRWTSKPRYDRTAHVPDLRVRLESLQRGQERLLSGVEEL